MGIFDFVREAGSPSSKDEIKSESMNEILSRKLADYGLTVTNSNIALQNGIITITGEAQDQSTREKVVLALGNVKGVSQVDDQMTVPASEEANAAVFHTVQSGDTLGKIAKQHYGNAGKYPVIFEANKPMLSDPNKIFPGQVLRIPKMEG